MVRLELFHFFYFRLDACGSLPVFDGGLGVKL